MTQPPLPQVALASQSPRRKQLLEQIGLSYLTVSVEVVEEPLAGGEAAEGFVVRLARDKALAGMHALARQAPWAEGLPVLGADTTVCVDGEILGKPRDREHGLTMLRKLSGRQHRVLTGVALAMSDGEVAERLQVSTVCFAPVSDQNAEAYWDSGEPADKAGAYAVQGRAAGFIKEIHGSFSGIMGLPLFETVDLLRMAGIFPEVSMFGGGAGR